MKLPRKCAPFDLSQYRERNAQVLRCKLWIKPRRDILMFFSFNIAPWKIMSMTIETATAVVSWSEMRRQGAPWKREYIEKRPMAIILLGMPIKMKTLLYFMQLPASFASIPLTATVIKMNVQVKRFSCWFVFILVNTDGSPLSLRFYHYHKIPSCWVNKAALFHTKYPIFQFNIIICALNHEILSKFAQENQNSALYTQPPVKCITTPSMSA